MFGNSWGLRNVFRIVFSRFTHISELDLITTVHLFSVSHQVQSLSAHLLNQVGDADPLQVPHGGQASQVSPLLQDVRQRLLPVAASADPPGDQTLPLLLLRELLPSAVTPAAAHQVRQITLSTYDVSLQFSPNLQATYPLLSTSDQLCLPQNPHWR